MAQAAELKDGFDDKHDLITTRSGAVGGMGGGGGAGGEAGRPAPPRPVDLSKVSARQNLNETAFFYPQLMSDSNGVVRMIFTMPEALTKWHFLAFAHDQKLRAGLLEGHTVTAKDIMVQPNPPRFLREGDTVKPKRQKANRPRAAHVRRNWRRPVP
jgi:uncharacterized protein YfaS (alpha-2-macroglobulin family)